MNKSLPISRLVTVNVNLAPNAAQAQDLSTLLILGSSGIINNVEKIRDYFSPDAVAIDFGTTAPEYLASVLYFQQSPQPARLRIGNWRLAANSAQLLGAPLNAQQQTLTNFTAVTNGYAGVVVDGIPITIQGLNFAGATNLNGVAQIVQNAAPAGFIQVVYNAVTNNFIVTSLTTGATSTISFFTTPVAAAQLLFKAPALITNTITLNGNVGAVLSFGAATAANTVKIGVSAADQAANLLAFLQAPFAGTNAAILAEIAKATYAINPSNLALVTATLNSASPFTFGLNANFAARTVVGNPIAGNNTFALFANTATDSGAYLAQGGDIQTPVQAVADYDNSFGQGFYAVTVLNATDDQLVDVSNFIEATNTKHVHGISATAAGVIVAATTTDIASRIKALGLKRTAVQYSSTNPYAVCSLFGRILTTDYTANNTVITLMYKQEPGIIAEFLSATDITTLESKNANVFVAYNNNTAIVEKGTMANGFFIDEVLGTDWLALTIQTAIFNALYTSTTKIPQTDSGVHTLITIAESVCAQGVVNGLLAPGVWTTGGFGALNQGDFMAKGFYVYAASVNTQFAADRAARKSPPIQVAAKLAGAIHTVNVLINVNR